MNIKLMDRNVQLEKIYSRIIRKENPVSVLLPSLEEDVNVVVNENGVPCIVVPVIGDIWSGSPPHRTLSV